MFIHVLWNVFSEIKTSYLILSYCGNVSGMKLNFSKCDGLWLGKDNGRQNYCNSFGIKWPKQVRCLGCMYNIHKREI